MSENFSISPHHTLELNIDYRLYALNQAARQLDTDCCSCAPGPGRHNYLILPWIWDCV